MATELYLEISQVRALLEPKVLQTLIIWGDAFKVTHRQALLEIPLGTSLSLQVVTYFAKSSCSVAGLVLRVPIVM